MVSVPLSVLNRMGIHAQVQQTQEEEVQTEKTINLKKVKQL